MANTQLTGYRDIEYGQKVTMRSIRPFLTGSLYEVWEDNRFIASPDPWCTNVHLVASRMVHRSKIKFQVSERNFQLRFMNLIPFEQVKS